MYVFFSFWLIIQFFIAHAQMEGFNEVSGLAHLGGVAAGFLFWAVTRHRITVSETELI